MEESDLIPEDINKTEVLSEKNEELVDQSDLKDSSESFSNTNNLHKEQGSQEINSDNQSNAKEESIFRRFLNDGFDGITTNPNYKLLALLIILLINLSLFLLVGNLGKSFLQNSGLLS